MSSGLAFHTMRLFNNCKTTTGNGVISPGNPYHCSDKSEILPMQISSAAGGQEDFEVVSVKSIKSVVGMIPHPRNTNHPELHGRVFVAEKPGLDLLSYTGVIPDDECSDNTQVQG